MAHNIALDFPIAQERAEPRAKPAGGAISLLDRLVTYLGRHRHTDGDVARYIQDNGGALTDQLEREIGRRFGHGI